MLGICYFSNRVWGKILKEINVSDLGETKKTKQNIRISMIQIKIFGGISRKINGKSKTNSKEKDNIINKEIQTREAIQKRDHKYIEKSLRISGSLSHVVKEILIEIKWTDQKELEKMLAREVEPFDRKLV